MSDHQTAEQQFTCEHCGGTFIKDWSEDEAVAEKDRDYPGVALKDCGVICDDCYQEFQKWKVTL
jgi:hypothetical protein